MTIYVNNSVKSAIVGMWDLSVGGLWAQVLTFWAWLQTRLPKT